MGSFFKNGLILVIMRRFTCVCPALPVGAFFPHGSHKLPHPSGGQPFLLETLYHNFFGKNIFPKRQGTLEPWLP